MSYLQRLLAITALAAIGMTGLSVAMLALHQPTGATVYAAEQTLAAEAQANLLGLASPAQPARAPAQQPLGWQSWQQLGGAITSAPAVVSWGGGRIDVFARGPGGEIVQTTFDGGRWVGWSTPSDLRGIVLRSAPSCTSLRPGTLNCVALRDGSAGVMQFWWDGQRWGWNDLGGDASSAPTIVAWGQGRLSVFVRNFNGNLIHKYWQQNVTDWTPPSWEAVGSGAIASAPSCTSRGVGIIDCFALDSNGIVRQLYYDESAPAGRRWAGWIQLSAPAGIRGGSPPTAVGWNRNTLDLFVRGSDLRLYHVSYSGRWGQSWAAVSDRFITSAPTCARVGDNQIGCFAELLDLQSSDTLMLNTTPGLSYTTARR